MCQECFLRGCLEGPSLIYFSVRAFMLVIGYVPLFGESRPALFNCPRALYGRRRVYVRCRRPQCQRSLGTS